MPDASLIARLQDAAPPQRSSLLVDHVIGELCKALHLDNPALVGSRSRFAELGIDSRRALELKEDLEEELGCTLPTTLFFNYPTPERLAAYVLDQALGLGTGAPDAGADTDSAPDAQPADAQDAGDIDAQMQRTFAKYGV